MNVVHISEEDAIRDFAAVLAKLDAGDEVVIDRLSGSLRLGRDTHEDLTIGEKLTRISKSREPRGVMDEKFAEDVREAIARMREVQPSPWD